MSLGIVGYWYALIKSVLSVGLSSVDQANQHPLPIIRGVKQPPVSANIIEQAQSAYKLLNNKDINPISNDSERLAKYTTIISKECLPGRDDAKGEINPTTNRNRECLRYAQKNSKPRIGIMVTPGYVSNGLGNWIKSALIQASSGNEFEVVLTPHVPVYGYGKSHGFSKLIRVTLPQPFASADAFLYEKLHKSSEVGADEKLDLSMIDEIKEPSMKEVETLIKLLMRWQCRLSHVSAHTSMISVTLDGVLNNPQTSLENIFKFVFTNDWEWEGGKGDKVWKEVDPNKEAAAFIDLENTRTADSSYLRRVTEDLIVIQGQLEQYLDKSVTSIIQNAFKEEMDLSEDLTHWPCPSFWEGVEKLKLNSDLVPDCRDDHPWIKCTINRDKCEVKQDPKC
jgi:hypothetical protein